MNRHPPAGLLVRDEAHRAVYSRAACIYARRPEAVLFPRGDEDLVWALELCRREGWPLTMRGGGSGLAGQTVGEGLVVDGSRWMNRHLGTDVAARTAKIQPGLVLSDLNRALRPSGLSFAPDPSSQDFCTLGGMVANHSKGPRSVKYGTTRDHVRRLRVLLADGAEVTLRRGYHPPDSFSHAALRAAARRIWQERSRIFRGWPRSRANASGYDLRGCLPPDALAPGASPAVDLIPLLVGSEGTLAVVLEAGLDLTPIPPHRALALLEFGDNRSAGRAVVDLLPEGPSACELLDGTFLDIIRGGLGTFPLPVRDDARAVLLLEADGESREEAEDRLASIVSAASAAGPLGVRRARDASERAAIWAFRKAASPLLNRGRGKLKSVRFIEDCAVPTDAIPDFLDRITAMVEGHGLTNVVFGHAGDGSFHVNPFLDLKDPEHFELLPRIAREAARMLADLGGTLSGEHGDGRLRTPYLPVVYGDLTGLFRDIKLLLDPEEILNPGIIAPEHAEPMEKGLRFHPGYRAVELPGRLSRPEWVEEAERCHGCGTCRDFCPTAQATDHDLLSSRGRAHLLQALLSGDLGSDAASEGAVRDLFESCLGCAQCALHCPTGVDIAPLAALYREAVTPPLARLRDSLMASIPSLGYRTGPNLGRLGGRLSKSVPARLASRALLGLRRDATAPTMAESFAFEPGRLHRFPAQGALAKAAYFYGCYGNTYNPAGEATLAVAVLRFLGADVVVPAQACCGVSKMARGLMDSVADDAIFTRRAFLPWLEEGYSLVASAPSCLLALTREQPRFLPGKGAELLASKAVTLSSFVLDLLERLSADGRPVALGPLPLRAVYQTPCHGAVTGMAGDDVALLRRIPGLDVVDVTGECCGMAGSFGAEARRAELSDAVGLPLYARIAAAKPEAVITPCGSCMTRVAERLGLPVYHPLTLLARSLGIHGPDVVGHSCSGGP